jgi:hypothetical protein
MITEIRERRRVLTSSRMIDFADIVICGAGEHARAFGLADRPGIVVETRKGDARVLYVDPDRSVWLPRPSLRHATPEEIARTPLAVPAEIARALRGHALEATTSPATPGLIRLVIGHGSIPVSRLDEIRRRFEGRIRGWAIRPAGLHRMESVIEIAP